MAEAAQKAAWEHTASVLAMLANIHRDKKKRTRPFRPEEFSPFSEKKETTPISTDTPEGLAEFRKVFLG